MWKIYQNIEFKWKACWVFLSFYSINNHEKSETVAFPLKIIVIQKFQIVTSCFRPLLENIFILWPRKKQFNSSVFPVVVQSTKLWFDPPSLQSKELSTFEKETEIKLTCLYMLCLTVEWNDLKSRFVTPKN